MAFDWLESTVPPTLPAMGARRRREMYIAEARTRAQLLKRLGYPLEDAERRILGPMKESHALLEPPPYLDAVRKTVQAAYHPS